MQLPLCPSQQVQTLATRHGPLYLTLMTWLVNTGLIHIKLFDICDRARLGERFFGATHSVLAQL